MKTEVIPVGVRGLGTVKKGIVENIDSVRHAREVSKALCSQGR